MPEWKNLPYFRTTVPVTQSMAELGEYVRRFPAARGYQVTELDGETTVRILIMVEEVEAPVRFALRPTGEERFDRQAARILTNAIKNYLAAVEAGILTLEEALVGHMETYRNGEAVTLGELMLEQVKDAKQIAPPRLGIGPAKRAR